MNRLPPRKLVWKMWVALILLTLNALPASSQEKRAKVAYLQRRAVPSPRLPLLAAQATGEPSPPTGSSVELIVMAAAPRAPRPWPQRRHRLRRRRRPGIGEPRHLTGLAVPGRSGFPRIRISYWTHGRVRQFKTLEDLKGKKDRRLRRRGRHQPRERLSVALEKSGAAAQESTYDGGAYRASRSRLLYSLRIRIRRRRRWCRRR